MQDSAIEQYRTAKILTAAPPKLHLMLVEGAARFAQQANAIWDETDRRDVLAEALSRCVDILSELITGLRSSDLAIAKQFVGIYVYILRCVSEAEIEGDLQKLQDAIRLLGIERETWRQVCEKFGESPTADSKSAAEHSGDWHANPTPNKKNPAAMAPAPAREGLSLEA